MYRKIDLLRALIILITGLLFADIASAQGLMFQRPERDKATEGQSLFGQQPRKSRLPFESLDGACPKSVRVARSKARAAAIRFARTHSLSTRSAFLAKIRKEFASCPYFVKKAYFDESQAILGMKPGSTALVGRQSSPTRSNSLR
jgi:hypothetical protein